MDPRINKDTAIGTLKKRLWNIEDQFRANFGLKSQENTVPILDIIFLRLAEVRFLQLRTKFDKTAGAPRCGSCLDTPAAYHADGGLYLLPLAHCSFILNAKKIPYACAL